MAFRRRFLSPRKLLIASIGVATASYVGCDSETSGNLVAPNCDEDPSFCAGGGGAGAGDEGGGGASGGAPPEGGGGASGGAPAGGGGAGGTIEDGGGGG